MTAGSFYEAGVTLIPKSDKDITRGKTCRPISPMNVDTKFLNTTFAHQIQQYPKRISHHERWDCPRNASLVQHSKPDHRNSPY